MKLRKNITFILIIFILFMGITTTANAATTKISMSRVTVSNIVDQKYTGNAITPNVVIRYNGTLLTKGVDYAVSYSNNRNVGTATIKITGKGDYTGTRSVTFNIVKTSSTSSTSNSYTNSKISMSNVTVASIADQKYTGSSITPAVTVRYNGEKLTQGTDYTVSYSNNRNIGTASIKITGKGDYTGTKTVTFKIVSAYSGTISMNRVTTQRIEDQYYTGSYIEPTVVLTFEGERLREDRDYTVTYSDNKKVGYGKIYIEGIGNYSGTKTIYFRIKGNSISISQATVSSILNQTYTGSYIRPSVTVKYDGERLTEGTDYTLSYTNNKNVGTATVKITGKGNYTGTKTVTFQIVKKTVSISKATVASILNQTYTGSYITPTVTVRYNGEKLTKGTDYTVSYSNNRNVGTATVKITGKGNYTGTKTVTFQIVKSSSRTTTSSNTTKISMSKVSVSKILNQLYTGSSIKPNIVVRYNGERLTEGTDYTVSYSNNKNVGTATVKITGKGNYTGTTTTTFQIVRR